jgi:hypothetical protein
VVIDPNDSTRAVNSPKTCYRIEPAALQLARSFGRPESPPSWSAISRTEAA